MSWLTKLEKGITWSVNGARTARAKWSWLGLTSSRRPILWTNCCRYTRWKVVGNTAKKIQFLQAPVTSFWTLLSFSTVKVRVLAPLNRTACLGKIQGRDGRKFLDRFKSYLGSQISSQSLNEIHIYRLQPKSATKGEFFFSHIFLSLIVSSSRRMLPFDVWPSFPVTTWTLP